MDSENSLLEMPSLKVFAPDDDPDLMEIDSPGIGPNLTLNLPFSEKGIPIAPPRTHSILRKDSLNRADSISTPSIIPPAPFTKMIVPPPSLNLSTLNLPSLTTANLLPPSSTAIKNNISLTVPAISDVMTMSPASSPATPEKIHPSSTENRAKQSMLNVPSLQFRSSSQDSLAVHSTEFICYAIFRFWHSSSPPSFAEIQKYKDATNNKELSQMISTNCPAVQWYPAFVTSVHRLLLSSGLHSHQHLPTVFLALLYVARLRSNVNAKDPKGPGSEYRVLVCALILAQKYLCDDRFSNQTWARLSNLKASELNAMEMEFLRKISYRLHVHGFDWDQWLKAIEVVRANHRRWASGLSSSQSMPLSYQPKRSDSANAQNAGLSVIMSEDDNLLRAFTWPVQPKGKLR
ncbi:hypothetical protein HK096_006809 [Nowakowskiella sp. JEL0078]|nr:hypothetical protein HK096_006809 [Nowakowskiella sp. JEL0078]